MRTGQWRRSLTPLLAAAVLAGCTSAEPQPEPTATQPTSSPAAADTPTPTNSPSDPYAIPDEITPEYVDLVVNRIYERHGELLRELLSQDPDPSAVMPVEMREHFAEIFDGQMLQRRIDEGDRALQGDRDSFRRTETLKQIRFATERVVAVGNGCLVAIGEWDNTAVADGGITIFAAVSLDAEADAATNNPTPWKLVDVALNRDADGKANPDDVMREATLAQLTEVALNTTCTEEEQP